VIGKYGYILLIGRNEIVGWTNPTRRQRQKYRPSTVRERVESTPTRVGKDTERMPTTLRQIHNTTPKKKKQRYNIKHPG